MPLPNQTVHIVPIQVSLSGSTAIITCSDPRARLLGEEIEFTLNPPNPQDPPSQRRVCLVVEDPPDVGGYDNYFNMSSAPPLERLVAWKRVGNTNRSPEMLPGYDFEVVAVAYSVPQDAIQPTTAVKIAHGRRRIKIRDAGAGGSGIF